MSIDVTAADLAGLWHLHKRIQHEGQPHASFEGRAEWRADGQGAFVYRETGHLFLPGHAPLQAERSYIWRGQDVYFDDGRFFHTMPFGGGSAHHWCAPDQYDVLYDFSGWPRFSTEWRVIGPRKNYVMHRTYQRLE